MHQALIWTALGTAFTFGMTAFGASMVLFIRNISANLHRFMMGFAAGIMIAASIWSLLIPAADRAESLGMLPWLPTAGGFIIGVAFLMLLDNFMPHLHIGSDTPEGPSTTWKRTSLLISAVTLHNIPEGMAVGLSFALAAQEGGGTLAAAIALAFGMGIQNFPEGAAISLPLRQEGYGRFKAFLWGAASGAVEPVFGILAVLAFSFFFPLMPWMLSFAAGAMMYVVVEELIPVANSGEHSNVGTLGAMGGFVLMMILDIALG